MRCSYLKFAPMLKNMPPLNLPLAKLQLSRSGEKIFVWDVVRKKNLVLTPEEWVRQHFIHFLLGRGYPLSSISTESGLYLNRQLRRTDILVFRNNRPALLIECKAPRVKISQEVFDQASRYNLELKTRHLVITNGLDHFFAFTEEEAPGYRFLEELPGYHEI